MLFIKDNSLSKFYVFNCINYILSLYKNPQFINTSIVVVLRFRRRTCFEITKGCSLPIYLMPVRSLFDLVDRQRAGDSRHSTGIYTIDVFVFRGISHGGVVLVSVICASFEETLAPVRQTLRVSWLSVISTPPAVEAGWSFDRTSNGRTRYFCLRDRFLYETRLWIERATYINLSRARVLSVKSTTNSSGRSIVLIEFSISSSVR